MDLVGSALGCDFGYRTRETAIFSVVGIADNSDVANRILAGSNDCRSTPNGALGADTVHGVAVVFKLLAVGVRRGATFRGEDTAARSEVAAAAEAGAGLRPGRPISAPSATLCSV